MQRTCCELQVRWDTRRRRSWHLSAGVHITVTVGCSLPASPRLQLFVSIEPGRVLSLAQVCPGQTVCCYTIQSSQNWCYIL